MKITVSNQIEMDIADIPPLIMKRIKTDLCLPNPEYQQAVKYGHNTYGKPLFIELWRTGESRLILPRGYAGTLLKHLRDSAVTYQLNDERLTLPPVDFGSSIQLPDYQEAAVSKLVTWKQGGVVAPCGAGKTMIMLEAMARIGQPALWITHTKELAEQLKERACSVFDMEPGKIGFIGAGQFSIGNRLTVALIQTLSKANIYEFKDRFGALFIDEAHHLAARSFFYPIGQFPAMYRLWVSATPDRTDGLTNMVFAAAGKIVHVINQSEVPTIIPQLRVIETGYKCADDNYTRIISGLIRDAARNRLIVETIAAVAGGNYSLVLSDRLEHLEELQRLLRRAMPKMRIEILTGSLKKKNRATVMEQVKKREVDILLATQLAREGLDIKHLNRLFLCMPKRSGSAVQQEIGRVMRPSPGKTDAIVFDFWDVQQPILQTQYWKRREVYRKIGMAGKLDQTRSGTWGN